MHLFGSTASRLNVRSSNDLDICLELPAGMVEEKGDKVRRAAMCFKRNL